MRTLVVYDTVFGNTGQIAEAIGNALGAHEDVEVLRVNSAKPAAFAGLGLLFVGSPTRGFRPTPATTNLLKSIPAHSLRGVRVAAFDTRIRVDEQTDSRVLRFMVGLFGYAAKPIADRLEKGEGGLVAPPEGFIVRGAEGPLEEGELERAAAWARQVLAAG